MPPVQLKYGLTQGSFHEMRSQFDAARAWLKDNDVGLSRPRVRSYNDDLNTLVDAIDTGSTTRIMSSGLMLRFLHTIHEVKLILSIYDGLKALTPHQALSRRLRKALRGPASPAEESSSENAHEGRDLSFELLLASLLVRAGYVWDPVSLTDVAISDKPIRVHIECKRPSSHETVDGCVKEAMVQLTRTLAPIKAGDTTFGMVALSIDRAVVPKDKFLDVPTNDHISAHLEKHLVEFSSLHKPSWAQPFHPRIVAVILLIHAPCVIRSENVPTSAILLDIMPTVSESNLGFYVYESVSSRLNSAINIGQGAR